MGGVRGRSGSHQQELVSCCLSHTQVRTQEDEVNKESVPGFILAERLKGGGAEGDGHSEHLQCLPSQLGVVAVNAFLVLRILFVNLLESLKISDIDVSCTGGPGQPLDRLDQGDVRKSVGSGLEEVLAESGDGLPDAHLAGAGDAGLERLLQHHGMVVGGV